MMKTTDQSPPKRNKHTTSVNFWESIMNNRNNTPEEIRHADDMEKRIKDAASIIELMKLGGISWKSEVRAVLDGNEDNFDYLLNRIVYFGNLFDVKDYLDRCMELPALMRLPTGEIIKKIVETSLSEIHQSRLSGWNAIDWLLDYELATRTDLGETENLGAAALLHHLWQKSRGYAIHPDEGHTRLWVSQFLHRVIQGGGSIAGDTMRLDALTCAARAYTQGENAGLLLGLLDVGAPYDICLNDSIVKEKTKDLVRQHPMWRRDNLGCVAVNTERQPHKTKF